MKEMEPSSILQSEKMVSDYAYGRKQALKKRFLIWGVVGVIVISICMSLGGYFRLQINENETLARRVHSHLNRIAKNLENKQADNSASALGILAFAQIVNAQGVRVQDFSGQTVWQKGNLNTSLAAQAGSALNSQTYYRVLRPYFLSNEIWQEIKTGSFAPVVLFHKVVLGDRTLNVVLMVDNSKALRAQRKVAGRLLLFLLLSTSLLFFGLYTLFLRGMKTIAGRERELNQQISRLSELLNTNKGVQANIRTASAKAVELNEQFLRRVGADLHDGPAQMIGFSVMRLNQALEKDNNSSVGNESHAIKKALEDALDEIRGISSGLVLPHLEDMTFEQCMRKVVLLHKANSPIQIKESYQEIERDIGLPVKICAYRFVQEGLNNAHKHGQADKCRLRVTLINNVLEVSLKDNGIGFRKSKLGNDGESLGLLGLKDRVASLGGKLLINSELGVGTALKLSISLVNS